MGALTRCVLLHSHSNLKVTWVKMQHNLNREYAFRITDIYIYIYIYILTNLLSTSIQSDKEKEKTLPEFRDNKSRITAWGKKKKKEKRPTSSHQLRKKIKRYAISWSKEKENPLQNAAMLQLQKVLNTK